MELHTDPDLKKLRNKGCSALSLLLPSGRGLASLYFAATQEKQCRVKLPPVSAGRAQGSSRDRSSRAPTRLLDKSPGTQNSYLRSTFECC